MTPEEVEEAAVAAVERFRARGGVVPAPPAREEIPARVPEPAPPRRGRGCPPAICWCGSCAWHVPLPPYDVSRIEGTLDWQRKRRSSAPPRRRASSATRPG